MLVAAAWGPAFSPGYGVAGGGMGPARLRLLGAFALECDGVVLPLPLSAQRVLAFVALHGRPLQRPFVAGSLWLDSSEERAHANLRSALWRLHRCGHRLVEAAGSQLTLGAGVEVDLREAERLARHALAPGWSDDAGPPAADVSAFSGDVLPDWYDDWVVMERERFRQLRLRALDALCDRLAAAGRPAEALEAGLASVAGEPLRESGHRALLRVHLSEGNVSEAIRHYGLYRRLLNEQLGIEPSPLMQDLLRGVEGAARGGRRAAAVTPR